MGQAHILALLGHSTAMPSHGTPPPSGSEAHKTHLGFIAHTRYNRGTQRIPSDNRILLLFYSIFVHSPPLKLRIYALSFENRYPGNLPLYLFSGTTYLCMISAFVDFLLSTPAPYLSLGSVETPGLSANSCPSAN